MTLFQESLKMPKW